MPASGAHGWKLFYHDGRKLHRTARIWRHGRITRYVPAILPLAGGSQMYLMQAEYSGPSVGKLVPKTRHTALIPYALYILLSVVEFILLLGGG